MIDLLLNILLIFFVILIFVLYFSKQPKIYIDPPETPNENTLIVRQEFMKKKILKSNKFEECTYFWSLENPYATKSKYLALLMNAKKKMLINHFPGTSEFFLKDRLYSLVKNLKIMPKSFIMPRDKETFLNHLQKLPTYDPPQLSLLLKEPNKERGEGIQLIHDHQIIRGSIF